MVRTSWQFDSARWHHPFSLLFRSFSFKGGVILFYCPKCKQELTNENIKFCPRCGFDFQQMYAQMQARFTPEKIKYYSLLILSSFLISALGLVGSFVYATYYIYILFVVISWYIILFLNKYVGKVDIIKIDSSTKKYLKRMSIFVLGINLINMATIINTIIALVKK